MALSVSLFQNLRDFPLLKTFNLVHETGILLPSSLNCIPQKPEGFCWIVSDQASKIWLAWWNCSILDKNKTSKSLKFGNISQDNWKFILLALNQGWLKAEIKSEKKRLRSSSMEQSIVQVSYFKAIYYSSYSNFFSSTRNPNCS